MSDLEAEILQDLSKVSLLKQLIEKLHQDSATKKMKTAESLCKVFEEYKSAVLNLNNSVTDFIWQLYDQVVKACLDGLSSTEDKFQAAWSLILLRLIKIRFTKATVQESPGFASLIEKLVKYLSVKVLSFLIREFEDLSTDFIEGINIYLQSNNFLAENFLTLAKSFPSSEKVKNGKFWEDPGESLPKKRTRVNNFDPNIEASKILVDTENLEFRYKESVSRVWLTVLSQDLKDSDFKLYLKHVPKIAFGQVSNPLIFSDFFLRAFDKGENFSVLSLNGLFVLSTRHGLEPKLYYNKLYFLLKSRLAKGKTLKSGFLRLVELSLTSHLLSGSLVASFIRLLVKESLRSSASQTVWTLALALKAIKIHPALTRMLNNDETEDVYDCQSNDPFATRAVESSLWEIQLLKKHWSPQVRDLVKDFEKNIGSVARIEPSFVELYRPADRCEIKLKDLEEIQLFNNIR